MAIGSQLQPGRLSLYVLLTTLTLLLPPSLLAQAPPAHRQTVRGTIVDRHSQLPLPGASVVVLGSDPLIGTAADEDGRFVLENIPVGRHDLQFSYIGYEPLILPQVLVSSGKETVLQVALKEQAVVGDEIVVTPDVRKDQPLNDMAAVSARSFSVEETRRYAGGLDDPARMAAAFAGVTGSAGLGDNALIIRGNAPKGVLWRLEGVEIPNPSHFAGLTVTGGGGLTLFSGQVLANSDFFTGAFPAEYGNVLAGVFDMNFRTGNPTQHERTIQLGVIGVEAALEGPFSRGSASTYLVNYRYSTLALLIPLLPTDSNVIRYQDVSFKLAFPTRRAGRFEIWGIGGLDGQRMSEEPDSSKWEYEIWDRLNYDLVLGVGAAGVSHTLPLGRSSYLKTFAAATVNHTANDQRRLADDLVLKDHLTLDNTTGRGVFGAFLNHRLSAGHVNRTGLTVQQLFYDLHLRYAPNDVPPLVPLVQGDGNSTLLQFYTQSKVDLSRRTTLNAGLHAGYFALTGHYTLEPRVSLRQALPGDQAIKVGYGLHSQIEDLRLYFIEQASPDGVIRPNRKLDFTKAHHLVLGYERPLRADTRLNAEVYYQYLFDVPVVPDSSFSMLNWEQDWTFDGRLVNQGAGKNYGVDLTLERFFSNGYYYLLTGSLFDSRYRGGDGVWRETRFDQQFAANALFGKEYTIGRSGNLLGINGRLMAMGGRRYSPIDHAASIERQEVVFDESRAFTERKSGIFIVDLTLTYRRNHRRFSDVWALQVKNVLGVKDTYFDYNFQTNRVEEVKEGYPVPVLSYKVEF